MNVSSISSCKKILISGTCWEYGKSFGECRTSDLVNPQNYFSLSKNTLRLWSEIISQQKSISFGWFRLFYVYGPGQRDESLIPSILKSLQMGTTPEIKTPTNRNDYIYVDDVVDIFTNATEHNFESGIFNVGNGK